MNEPTHTPGQTLDVLRKREAEYTEEDQQEDIEEALKFARDNKDSVLGPNRIMQALKYGTGPAGLEEHITPASKLVEMRPNEDGKPAPGFTYPIVDVKNKTVTLRRDN